jgi:hypothetical protein
VSERQVLRGFLANVTVLPPLIVTFQFNPSSIRDTKQVRYADRDTGLSGSSPCKVYTGGGDRTLSFELVLNGLEQGSNRINPTPLDNGISTELAKLRSFLYPADDPFAAVAALAALFGAAENAGRRVSAPPKCLFGFGTKILECVVTEVTVNETQFNSLLAPVQAQVSVTLVVVEEPGNAFYEVDNVHRALLATLGLQNVSVFA